MSANILGGPSGAGNDHAGLRRYAAIVLLPALAVLIAGARSPARSEEPAVPRGSGRRRASPRIPRRGRCRPYGAVPGAISARGATEYTFNLASRKTSNRLSSRAGFDKTVALDHRGARSSACSNARCAPTRCTPISSFPSITTPCRTICCRPGSTRVRNITSMTIIRATRCSFPIRTVRPGRQSVVRQVLGTELQARGLAYTPHYICR